MTRFKLNMLRHIKWPIYWEKSCLRTTSVPVLDAYVTHFVLFIITHEDRRSLQISLSSGGHDGVDTIFNDLPSNRQLTRTIEVGAGQFQAQFMFYVHFGIVFIRSVSLRDACEPTGNSTIRLQKMSIYPQTDKSRSVDRPEPFLDVCSATWYVC